MPRSKNASLSSLSVADLKSLLVEKEIEVLNSSQAELEANLKRVEKDLARLLKGAAIARPAAKNQAKRGAAKPSAKKARKTAGAKSALATSVPTIETIVVDLLKANGAPMAVPEILAAIKKQKLVKTKAANFDGVLRQARSKSSKFKRVRPGVYRA
jgi:hypothetical protein